MGGILYGTHTQKGFFMVWGALFLLLSAAGIAAMGGIELYQVNYYDADLNLLTKSVVWELSDTILYWFDISLFVIGAICLLGMIGSNSIEKTPTDVYHW